MSLAAPVLAPVLGITPPRPLLLGLAGPAGCGKSTTATLLASDGGWGRVSFADPLRQALLALHPAWDLWHLGPGKDLTPADGGLSPREQMRALGDWVKTYQPAFFIEAAVNAIGRHWRAGRHVVLDDVRYDAEVTAIRRLGGVICHVSRPEIQFRRDHSSETGVTPRPEDLHLRNWSGLQALQHELFVLLSTLLTQIPPTPTGGKSAWWCHITGAPAPTGADTPLTREE